MPIQEYSLDPELLDKINMGASGGPIGRGATEGPWYVDLNRRAAGDGLSWDEAYDTYAKGIAAATAWFADGANRAWAKRGTLYCCSDGETESITTLPSRTDMIGVGTDTGTYPKVTGTHTVASAVSGNGVRIINMGFIPTSTAPILTLPSGCHGIELHHVRLFPSESYTNSSGLKINTSRDWVLNDVHIYQDAGGVKSTIGLEVSGTTSGIGRAQMRNCLIIGVEGMDIADTSADYEGAMCKDSVFIATALCIDDNSDSMAFVGCRLITAANSGSATGSTIVDWNAALAVDNYAVSGNADGPLPALDAHA